MHPPRRFLLATILLGSCSSSAPADDWPGWLGPRRDSVWRETGIVATLPANGPPVRWRTAVGAGFSGPAVAAGHVYLTDRVHPADARDQKSGRERVLCLNEADGTLLWKHEYECPYTIDYPLGPRTTPLVHGDAVYTLGAEGHLFRLDANTGRVRWSHNLPQEYKAPTPHWGYAAHPLLDGPRLVCMVGGKGSAVVAFDKDTGKEVWRSLDARELGYCPPTICEAGGKRQLIVWHGEAVNALDPETGKPYWSFPVDTFMGMAIAAPRRSGDLFFVTPPYNKSLVLRLAADRPAAAVLWRAGPKKVSFDSCFGTPFAEGGYVYGTTAYGEVCCIRPDTGERLWTTLEPNLGKKRQSSDVFIVKNGDRFFLWTEQGDLIIARLSPQKYEQFSRAHVLDPTFATHGRPVLWSHPAFANRCLYARNDKELVCVSLAAAPAEQPPADPTGYFEGALESKQEGTLDVALNLRRVGGRYEGTLATPVGTFTTTGATFREGVLRLDFALGSEPGTIEARREADLLRGTFRSGGDSGTVTLRRVGAARPATASELTLQLTPAQWREDLRFLARELPKRHANAFHHTPREQFEAAVAKLDHQIDGLNGDEMYVGLNRIANLIGDAHTFVRFPPDTARMPLALARFGDEYRVTLVAPGLEKALGARVVKVGSAPLARARQTVLPLTPQDETPNLADARASRFLTLGLVLHGCGLTADRRTADYTLLDDAGHEFTATAHALPPAAKPHWIAPYTDPPLFRRHPEQSFRSVYLSGPNAVYCNFRAYDHLGEHARDLFKLIDERRPDKLVIDLRQNGGGDFTLGLRYLIQPLRDRSDLNRKGRLFVLIGPDTFSAAMSNAAHFRARTNAILVGETIGEKPNSYQEGRQFTLPNSHLVS